MFNALLNVRKFYGRKRDGPHSKDFKCFSQNITSFNRTSLSSISERTQTYESVALSQTFAQRFLFC